MMKLKKYALLAALFFPMLYLQGQDTLNRVDAQGKKTGYWKKYDGKTLLYEGRFQKDVPIGEFKYYYPDGSLKSITQFLNGPHKVRATLFHANGKKSAEGIFMDQQKEGEWEYYSPAGRLIQQENYREGKKTGAWNTFSAQTGIRLLEEHFDQGVLHGLRNEYYTSGTLKSSVAYIGGKRNGRAAYYFTGNILETSGDFHNDKMIGTWDVFDDAGKLRKQIGYEEGKPKSTLLVFYAGQAPLKVEQSEVLFIQKLENGVEIHTRTRGKLQSTDDFERLKFFIDPLEIVQVTPSLMVDIDAIRGYKKLEEDEEAILVVVEPAFDREIIARDHFALLIKSFCDTTVPVLESE